ncbi:hypothetical protein ACQJBY_030311 [Aegilops geniculata]
MAAFTTTAAAAAAPAAYAVARSPAPSPSQWAPPRRAPPAVGLRRAAAPPRRGDALLVKSKKETFSTFEELLEKSEKPLLVDFYATWCGPCQYMVPILQEVHEKMNDKINIVKIDTEKYTSIANKYKIEALPTFVIFKDGEPCYRFEGALPADQLILQIESALEAPK